MAEGSRMWAISLLTITLLTLLSAAPIDITDDIKKEDVKADNDGMHSHDENVTRGGKFFGHNQFDIGNINVPGSVAGDDVSVGHEVNIDVQGNTHDHHHHEVNIDVQGHTHDHHHHEDDTDLEGFLCMFNDAELDLPTVVGDASPGDRAYRWENNLIPYFFTSASYEDKALFKSVMDIIEQKTCFKFKEETEDACGMKPCLEIMTEKSKSCSTGCRHGFVGITKLTPYKRVLLKSNSQVGDKADCTLRCQGFALHELMHVLGVGHTVNRRDRDSFIEINEKNSKTLKIEKALIKCENCLLYDNYDCSSIMHMGTHLNGLEVLKPKDPNTCSLKKHAKSEDGPFGSDLDWKLLNGIGNCAGVLKEVKECLSLDDQHSDEWCTKNCRHTPPNCPEDVCKCRVWHTLFESTSGSCLDYIENRHDWTDSTGNGVAQLAIPLEEDIKSYEIQMETDVPLTGLKFWTADAVPSTGTIFRITPNSDSKFSGANKGQKLRLRFQMTYEGSEQPTAFSIIFNDKMVCDDTSAQKEPAPGDDPETGADEVVHGRHHQAPRRRRGGGRVGVVGQRPHPLPPGGPRPPQTASPLRGGRRLQRGGGDGQAPALGVTGGLCRTLVSQRQPPPPLLLGVCFVDPVLQDRRRHVSRHKKFGDWVGVRKVLPGLSKNPRPTWDLHHTNQYSNSCFTWTEDPQKGPDL